MCGGAEWEKNRAPFFFYVSVFAASLLCWLFVFSCRQPRRRCTMAEIIAVVFFIIFFPRPTFTVTKPMHSGMTPLVDGGGIIIFVCGKKKKRLGGRYNYALKITSRVPNIDFQSWMFLNTRVLLPSVDLPSACFAKRQGRLVGNNSGGKWLETKRVQPSQSAVVAKVKITKIKKSPEGWSRIVANCSWRYYSVVKLSNKWLTSFSCQSLHSSYPVSGKELAAAWWSASWFRATWKTQ